MASPNRYLTKSRFTLAAECPRKLYYTGKEGYLDRSVEDSFLAALAEGGFQVGELACRHFPDGHRIDTLDIQEALAQTAVLLRQDQVTLFEAALSVGTLLIRVDVLRKNGTDIELIEVKAKSYRADKDGDLRGAHGKPTSSFLPYLRDVAFQRYVAQQALPGLRVRAFLMLMDKGRRATVDGLNQRFKAVRVQRRLRIEVAPGTDAAALGQPLLIQIPVDSLVDEILASDLLVAPGRALPFASAVTVLSEAYAKDLPLPPKPSAQCGNCQFRSPDWPVPGQPRSGFHECWSEAFGWSGPDFADGTVLDLWHFRGKDKLIGQGVLKLKQVHQDDLKFDGKPPDLAGMTRQHRQWYTCQPDWPGGGDFFFDREGFEEATKHWRYPLHCIDFETSAAALPFVRGRRPYEVTAFQFSHHVIEADGRVQHRSQWLCAQPGLDPNEGFVRALRDALKHDRGTVLRWAAHENTVLNMLREQLLGAPEPPADRAELIAFIDELTTRPVDGQGRVAGPRSMVDLCAIAEKYYFAPSTRGSNSLKKVLPALMSTSDFLRETYSQPTYGGPGISLNFNQPIAWWQQDQGVIVDPYKLLPPVFDDIEQAEIDAAEEGLSEELREGGAAMAAYGRLQFESLTPARRQSIENALLRYCELDTLAMVMAIQAWQAAAHR